MRDVVQTYRDKKGRFTKRGYAFDDDAIIHILETQYRVWGKKLFSLGLVIGLVLGTIIGICI